MVDRQRVTDLMVPLHEYAVVDETATLLDALDALERSQQNLPPGRFLHRAVLVRRGTEIVGRLGHLAFLEAIVRGGESVFRGPLLDAAGLSDEMVRTSMSHLRTLVGDLGDLCARARRVRVREVMRPAALRISDTASLEEAIELMLEARVLALLVTSGRTVAGVLRSSDVFAELARRMRDCPPGGE